MSKAESIRVYYREHPDATYKEVAEALNLEEGFVRSNVYRDINQYKICVRKEDGSLDYEFYYKADEEKKEFLTYTKEVLLELVEQLRSANRRETDSNQIRLNCKEIRSLLQEIAKL
ncbi:hypothetical protein GGG87_03705 [Streptococcus sp. zg-86]|uniref:Phage protein n=1 Tax=Streptococcus zhangguiae TaxID=2664091 RepID=A0A6I4RPR8_9STRE|nr:MULTISPECIES: hypothetical protein [unclassified Streptococcus]MTB64107.1 hypothetical protein [Streptococcus sp. zg-86]MTB90567.1 hypothetical protein [Streptococcus sp. zg-36]MWV56095.1 hypothetical protein [Streptococcus sp. zg-70]QTH48276.1 hypothetical protein J5M87_02815 [Streptococcus sp. zg-86]